MLVYVRTDSQGSLQEREFRTKLLGTTPGAGASAPRALGCASRRPGDHTEASRKPPRGRAWQVPGSLERAPLKGM